MASASARASGIRRLTASTLWDRAPARPLLRRLAFRESDGGHVLQLELDLADDRAKSCR
jgi:hypothetical protein